MADNINIKDASGATVGVASDQVTDGSLGTVQVQYIKLMDGTLDGTNKLAVNSNGTISVRTDTSTPGTTNGVSLSHIGSTAVATGNGVVGTGVQRVAIASDNSPIPISGTLTTDQSTPGTTNGVSLSHIGSTATATGNGVVSAGVQRVAIASDNTAFSVNATSLGNVAHDGVDSGNPVKIGGKAINSNPTAVSSGDRTDASFDLIGRQVVVNGHVREMRGFQSTTISNTTETTIVTAQSGFKLDIDWMVITNSGSSSTVVTLRDTTAGTAKASFNIPAGGGLVLQNILIPQSAANTNWTAQCATASTSVQFNIGYIKNI